MPSQNAKGWSGILEGVDEPPAEERTDPHLDASGLSFDDPDAVSDEPVGARAPAPAAPAARPKQIALPRIPTPATQVAMKPALPAPKARSTSAGRLKLPTPGKTSGGPPAASAPLAGADGSPAFSTEHLMDKLGDSDAAPPASAAKVKSNGLWTEYKEVILSAIGGGLLLLAVLAYQRFGKVEPMVIGEVPPADPTMAAPADAAEPIAVEDPQVPPTPEPPVEVAPIPDDTPKRAAVPMISLLSSPSGATVEINGEVQGKTPLISPAPPNLAGMRVTIRLEGYKKWTGEVTPNEVGNYSLLAKLEPNSH